MLEMLLIVSYRSRATNRVRLFTVNGFVASILARNECFYFLIYKSGKYRDRGQILNTFFFYEGRKYCNREQILEIFFSTRKENIESENKFWKHFFLRGKKIFQSRENV